MGSKITAKKLLLIALGVLGLNACSETTFTLPPGRCDSNSDCRDGEECVKTYCEDIYHPRRSIKPY